MYICKQDIINLLFHCSSQILKKTCWPACAINDSAIINRLAHHTGRSIGSPTTPEHLCYFISFQK